MGLSARSASWTRAHRAQRRTRGRAGIGSVSDVGDITGGGGGGGNGGRRGFVMFAGCDEVAAAAAAVFNIESASLACSWPWPSPSCPPLTNVCCMFGAVFTFIRRSVCVLRVYLCSAVLPYQVFVPIANRFGTACACAD